MLNAVRPSDPGCVHALIPPRTWEHQAMAYCRHACGLYHSVACSTVKCVSVRVCVLAVRFLQAGELLLDTCGHWIIYR